MNDVTVTEGNAGTTTATFTVTLSAASGKTVDVRLGHRRRLGHRGHGLRRRERQPHDRGGATTATIAITVNGDVLDEADETFGVTLSNPANATIADGSGLGTITDDDPAPTLSVERRHRHRGQRAGRPPRRSPSPSRPRAGRP